MDGLKVFASECSPFLLYRELFEASLYLHILVLNYNAIFN